MNTHGIAPKAFARDMHGTMTTVLSVMILFCCTFLWAEDVKRQPESDAVHIDFNLTPSFYQSSDGNNASDVNLRTSHGAHAGRIGFYRDQADYQQTRAGYEFTSEYELARIVWSAQAATGGFLGGSINAQIGGTVYGLAGFGRTNLKIITI